MWTVIENIKFIAECVTAISAAIIVFGQVLKIIPKSLQEFFTKVIPVFFCGFTTLDGKKAWFFRAVKAQKEYQQLQRDIIKAVAPDFEMEEVLVLNTSELIPFLSESKLFTKVPRRKR